MGLSLSRILAVLAKEFTQLVRDRLTYAMILGVPIVQLLLFGYAINTDPKHLPTAVLVQDQGDLRPLGPRRNRATANISTSSQAVRTPAELDRLIATRHGPVRDHHTRRFHPPGRARREAADPGRGGCLGSGRDGRRRRRHSPSFPQYALKPRPQGPARQPRDRRSSRSRWSSSAATIPKAMTSYNIVPGLLGTILVDDAGDDDRAGDDPRGRARNDGDLAGDAAAGRSK